MQIRIHEYHVEILRDSYSRSRITVLRGKDKKTVKTTVFLSLLRYVMFLWRAME